jgi:hypothetical protein
MIFDALPYVDPVNEEYETYALALIEEEMKTLAAPPKLPSLPPMKFSTELLKHEYDQRSQRLGPLDSIPFLNVNNNNAVQKARVEWELERLRTNMLGVDRDEAATLWRAYNEMLEMQVTHVQFLLERQRERVEGLNLNRQNQQEEMGRELVRLAEQYDELVRKQYLLKEAVGSLEEELAGNST